MRANGIAWWGLALALCATPAWAQPLRVLQLDFKAHVQADGTPADIQPDAALPPMLQAMVRKRVAQWRYRVGTWQDKPVPASVSQRIVAEVLPVASGGFALRIREVASPVVMVNPHRRGQRVNMPPLYPAEVMQRGVAGTLVYAYRVNAAGEQQELELVHPQLPDRDFRLLDAAGRAAMAKWTFGPTRVGNAEVDCRVLMPMVFSLDKSPAPATPDLTAFRASHPDACPAAPVLLTEVAGSML